jgi:S1-C subfamily serine protease
MDMSTDNSIWQLAEAYVNGSLGKEEKTALEQRVAADSVFAASFQECTGLIRSMQHKEAQASFRSMLADIHATQHAPAEKASTKTIPLRTHYLRTGAIAAGIALLTSLGTGLLFQNAGKHKAPYTQQLGNIHNEIENLKRGQNQLNQKINSETRNQPATPGNMSGTGFALTNDGYIVTNYHVVANADSLYIQTNNGEYYKAYMTAYDANNDVAILQVEDKDFRFGKGELPYSFAASKAGLGARVYTVGYPNDELVYNEGYISSRNGLKGDSMQYRLELPSAPGQSGSPVVDAQGSIVAIVTSKQAESESNTYAVSSKVLLQLVRTMPKEQNVHLSKSSRIANLSREQQISKLENYTCIVQVYKNR